MLQGHEKQNGDFAETTAFESYGVKTSEKANMHIILAFPFPLVTFHCLLLRAVEYYNYILWNVLSTPPRTPWCICDVQTMEGRVTVIKCYAAFSQAFSMNVIIIDV